MHDGQKENQAAKLEQLFLEVANPELNEKSGSEQEPEKFVEVDVLQLPPRSEVHKESKMGFHLSSSTPFMRFIFVIIVLVVIAGFFYGFYGDEVIDFFIS